MRLGIDFDGTFAAHPDFFKDLLVLAVEHNVDTVLVTQRCPKFEEEVRAVVGPSMHIIWASGYPKEDAARREGIKIDVWMDDNPLSVSTALTYRGC